MSQRKDKNDKSNCNQDAFLHMLILLESPNSETVESVKYMIQEDLCKDAKLLNSLVNFYIATQSKSSFEILLHLKDPHDKHLFEKINEMMKNKTTRYNALQLLGNIVYKQPTWLYKIGSQRVLHTLIEILKTDFNCTNLLSGLFILICLLPMIPYLFGPFLREIFDIFSRFASWNVKKPNTLSDVLNLHLQTGVYSLFHRLYGMFPCNFLAYLRSFYGGFRDSSGENGKVFILIIKPMLERVRLHPLLVTASKEAELNVNRWKKMAYHDVIVECASISLDTIEGTLENLKSVCSSIFSQSNFENSSNIHSQNNSAVMLHLEFVVNDTAMLIEESVWSPSQTCLVGALPFSSNVSSPTTVKGEWEFKNLMQSSTEESIPLDFAVEAKPELLKSEISEKSPLKDFNDSNEVDIAHIEKQIIPQTNANLDSSITNTLKNVIADTKEDDVDKEVSELTASDTFEQCFNFESIRHDTPFCSTTQNLTDEPAHLNHVQAMMSLSGRSDSLTKSTEDDVDEVYNSMQEPDIQPYVSKLTRYRYFSQCGPPPNIVCAKKTRVFRSLSCPAALHTEFKNPALQDSKSASEREKSKVHSMNEANLSAFDSLDKDNIPVYEKLLPTIVNPLQDFSRPILPELSTALIRAQNSNSLSPPELLDHYIQQSSTNYLAHLPLTAKKDTDWTYFGGKPPSDEIDVLRNQVLLLYNMLLFERHRKDVHSERNRRILGRAKRIRMQEEYVDTLKREIAVLTEENTYLKTELSNQYKSYQLFHLQNKQSKDELDSKLSNNLMDITQLSFSNRQIQTLLVSQKEENDEIRNMYKKVETEIAFCKYQLKYALLEVHDCQKFKKEAIYLTKQLIILQELNNQFKHKVEQIKEVPADIGAKLMINSVLIENEDLKKKLDETIVLLDCTKKQLLDLENVLTQMKLKEKEKLNTYEEMKNFHQAEIMAREDRLSDLQKISLEKDAHIYKLYADIEVIKENFRASKKKQVIASDFNGSDNGHDSTNQTEL